MKNSSLLAPVLCLGLLILGSSSSAEKIYSYARLATKSLDEMNKIVTAEIDSAKNKKGDITSTEPVENALQAIFSRPDPDNIVAILVGSVKNQTGDDDQYEEIMTTVVTKAISRLKNSKNNTPEAQMTDVVLLTNVISQSKPQKDKDFEASLIRQIRDEKIKLTSQARAEGRGRAMIPIESPSDFAETVLPAKKDKKDQEEKAKKAKEKEALRVDYACTFCKFTIDR